MCRFKYRIVIVDKKDNILYEEVKGYDYGYSEAERDAIRLCKKFNGEHWWVKDCK